MPLEKRTQYPAEKEGGEGESGKNPPSILVKRVPRISCLLLGRAGIARIAWILGLGGARVTWVAGIARVLGLGGARVTWIAGVAGIFRLARVARVAWIFRRMSDVGFIKSR